MAYFFSHFTIDYLSFNKLDCIFQMSDLWIEEKMLRVLLALGGRWFNSSVLRASKALTLIVSVCLTGWPAVLEFLELYLNFFGTWFVLEKPYFLKPKLEVLESLVLKYLISLNFGNLNVSSSFHYCSYAELITFGLCQIVKKCFCTIYCTWIFMKNPWNVLGLYLNFLQTFCWPPCLSGLLVAAGNLWPSSSSITCFPIFWVFSEKPFWIVDYMERPILMLRNRKLILFCRKV